MPPLVCSLPKYAFLLIFFRGCLFQSDGDANDSDAMTTTTNIVSSNGDSKTTEAG